MDGASWSTLPVLKCPARPHQAEQILDEPASLQEFGAELLDGQPVSFDPCPAAERVLERSLDEAGHEARILLESPREPERSVETGPARQRPGRIDVASVGVLVAPGADAVVMLEGEAEWVHQGVAGLAPGIVRVCFQHLPERLI